MTLQNDFNTLINTIIDNLEEMGVTDVSFESETGIMGLIDRILEIETGSSIEVPTVINAVMTLPGPNTTITVGDAYTCSGALRGSYNNFAFKIGGATIYAYNHDDLLGQAVTDSDGNFTISGMYHKATSSVNYSLRFLATDIFLSSTFTQSATKPVNKKSITLPQSINDTWTLTPDEYSVNIGSQYQNAPITLMIDSQRYDMEYVDENGVVTFDISNLTGVNECQLAVETNDVFSNAQSNTFNISTGVNIYINPELQVTSDKDILSYADNESATITAQLIGGASPQNLEIPNYDIIFSIPTNYTDISNMPTQYGSFAISFKATQGTFNVVGDTTNYEKSTVTIPNNNASQFKLVWSGNNMRLYQDGNYLQNNVTDMFGVDNDTYEGNYANFENNNGITFSDICMEYYEATDNTGKAAFTYNSRGVGDVTFNIKIDSMFVSEIYSIQDIALYDDCSNDKSSSYDLSNYGTGTITYDGTNKCYKLNPQIYAHGILIRGLTVSNNIQIDIDIKINPSYNEQFIIGVYNPNESKGIGGCSMISPQYNESVVMIRNNFTLNTLGSEVSRSNNTHTDWHHITFKVQGTSITAIINGVTKTTTSNLLSSTGNQVVIITYSGNADGNDVFRFKNLKVREL